MGVSSDGRLATLTNIRAPYLDPRRIIDVKSRGA